jgi:hypothetical protein
MALANDAVKRFIHTLLRYPSQKQPAALLDYGYLLQYFFNEIKKRPHIPSGIALHDLTTVMAELREMLNISFYVAQEKPSVKLIYLTPENILELSAQAHQLATNIIYRAIQKYKTSGSIEECLDGVEKDPELYKIPDLITKAKKLSEELLTNKMLLEQYEIHVKNNGVQFPDAPDVRKTLESSGFKYQPTLFNSTRFICLSCSSEILNLSPWQSPLDYSIHKPDKHKENLFNIVVHFSKENITISKKLPYEQKISSESALISMSKSILFAPFSNMNLPVPECRQQTKFIQDKWLAIALQKLRPQIFRVLLERDILNEQIVKLKEEKKLQQRLFKNVPQSIVTNGGNEEDLMLNFKELLCRIPKEVLEKSSEFSQSLKKFESQLHERNDLERKQKQDIENTLTCPICFEIMGNPVLLGNCGHSVCYECLKNVNEFAISKKSPLEREQTRVCPVCSAPIMEEIFNNLTLNEQVRRINPKKLKDYPTLTSNELYDHAMRTVYFSEQKLAIYTYNSLKHNINQIYFQRGFYLLVNIMATRVYCEKLIELLSKENTVEIDRPSKIISVRSKFNTLTDCEYSFVARLEINGLYTLHYIAQGFKPVISPGEQFKFDIEKDASREALPLPLPITKDGPTLRDLARAATAPVVAPTSLITSHSEIATTKMNNETFMLSFKDLLCRVPKDELEKNIEFSKALKRFEFQVQERKQKQDIENTLYCPMCSEIMGNPLLLGNCGHSICYECFKTSAQSIENKKTLSEDKEKKCCPVCSTPIIGMVLKNLVLQEQIKKIAPTKVKPYPLLSENEIHLHAWERIAYARTRMATYTYENLRNINPICFRTGFYLKFPSPTLSPYIDKLIEMLCKENNIEIDMTTKIMSVISKINPLTDFNYTFVFKVGTDGNYTTHVINKAFTPFKTSIIENSVTLQDINKAISEPPISLYAFFAAPAPTIVPAAPAPTIVCSPELKVIKNNIPQNSQQLDRITSVEIGQHFFYFPCPIPAPLNSNDGVYAAIIRHFLNEIQIYPEGTLMKNFMLILTELREIESIMALYAKYNETEDNPLILYDLTYENISTLRQEGISILYRIIKHTFDTYKPSSTVEELFSKFKDAPVISEIEFFITDAKQISKDLANNKVILKWYQTYMQEIGMKFPHTPGLLPVIEDAGFIYQPTLLSSDHFICIDCSAEISGWYAWQHPLDSSLHKPVPHRVKLMNTLEWLNSKGVYLQSSTFSSAVEKKKNVESNSLSIQAQSRTLLFSSFPERNICVIERPRAPYDRKLEEEVWSYRRSCFEDDPRTMTRISPMPNDYRFIYRYWEYFPTTDPMKSLMYDTRKELEELLKNTASAASILIKQDNK